jgi:hypothetical protein
MQKLIVLPDMVIVTYRPVGQQPGLAPERIYLDSVRDCAKAWSKLMEVGGTWNYINSGTAPIRVPEENYPAELAKLLAPIREAIRGL